MTSAAATGSVEKEAVAGFSGARRGQSVWSRHRGSLWPLGLYTLLSLLMFGLPVLGDLSSRIIASDAIDSSQFMWFFAWWPHALLHGLNPFVTHVMFVPQGFNLTWSTAMPGPAILLSPITLAFGPAVTWNVIELASPAFSAWTAFLLCRHVTGRLWPSLIGGYVFGFSPFVITHLTGGPYLAFAALLPLFVLLVLRRMQGSISPRGFVVAMTLALTAQYTISSETLAMASLFGGTALVLAFALFPERRAALLDAVKPLVMAYAATAILISPFLYFFFFGHQYPPGATYFPADLTSYVIPPPIVAITRHVPPFAGSGESYLGLPMIAIIALFTWQRRRQRTTWLIVLSLLAAGICSLGDSIVVHGRLTSFQMPWHLIGRLPVLRYAIPLRLAVFVVLPAALIVAIWCSDAPSGGRGSVARWGLALLAVAFILPDFGSAAWNTSVKDPPFFSTGAFRRYLKPTDRVLTYPAWGPNERWQADSGFRFLLADGYAGNPFPPSYSRYPIWATLTGGPLAPNYASALRSFMLAKGVTAIVVDASDPGPWPTLFKALKAHPLATGGVLLYRPAPGI